MMGDPNDIRKAIVDAAQRIHAAASLIRRLRSQLGDHRDLEPEAEAALQLLTVWARQQLVATNSAHAAPKPPPPPVEPGPLAAKPRLRQSNRRTRR